MPTPKAPQTKQDFVQSQAIQSTQALLATHGLSLTMDQIAEGSGISRRSLFRHFESRDTLVRAALDAAIDGYEEALTATISTDGDSNDWLTDVIAYTHRSHLAAGLAIWQLSSTADSELPPHLVDITERRRAMRRRATEKLAAQAWESAGGSGPPPDVVAESIALAVSSYATHSLVLDFEQSIDEAARLSSTIITIVIDASLQR